MASSQVMFRGSLTAYKGNKIPVSCQAHKPIFNRRVVSALARYSAYEEGAQQRQPGRGSGSRPRTNRSTWVHQEPPQREEGSGTLESGEAGYSNQGQGERRQYNNRDGGRHQYNGERRQYYGERRQYNGGQEGEEGQQQYRERRQYSNGGGAGQRQYNGERRYNNSGERRQYNRGEEGSEGGYDRSRPYNSGQSNLINDLIRSAQSWKDLAPLLTEHAAQLHSGHIAMIMAKAGRVHGAMPDEEREAYDLFLSSMLGWILQTAPSMRAWNPVVILPAMSRLNLWNEEVGATLCAKAASHMAEYSPKDLAAVAGAVAKFGYNPGEAFMSSLLSTSQSLLSEMSGYELGRIIAALAKLKVSPPQGFMHSFCEVTLDKLPSFNGLDLSSIFAGVADIALHTQPPYQPPPAWVEGLLGAAPQGLGAEGLKAYELPRWLRSVAAFQTRPPPAFYDAWFGALGRMLDCRACSPNELSQCCMYLGRFLGVACPPDVLDELLGSVRARTRRFTGDGLAFIAYYLAVSGAQPNERWLEEVVIAVMDKVEEASAEGLSLLYDALPKLGGGMRVEQAQALVAARYHKLLDEQAKEAGAAATAEEAASNSGSSSAVEAVAQQQEGGPEGVTVGDGAGGLQQEQEQEQPEPALSA